MRDHDSYSDFQKDRALFFTTMTTAAHECDSKNSAQSKAAKCNRHRHVTADFSSHLSHFVRHCIMEIREERP